MPWTLVNATAVAPPPSLPRATGNLGSGNTVTLTTPDVSAGDKFELLLSFDSIEYKTFDITANRMEDMKVEMVKIDEDANTVLLTCEAINSRFTGFNQIRFAFDNDAQFSETTPNRVATIILI